MLEKTGDERQLRALTGLPREKFAGLSEAFTKVYQAEQARAYGQGLKQRRAGGGRKGKPPGAEAKLLSVLYCFKNDPTFDVWGTHFDMAPSQACENPHKLAPLLYKTRTSLAVWPERTCASAEAFKAALAEADLVHRQPNK